MGSDRARIEVAKATRIALSLGLAAGVAAHARPGAGQEPEAPALELQVVAPRQAIAVLVELSEEPAVKVYQRTLERQLRGHDPRRLPASALAAARAEANRAARGHLRKLEGAQSRLAGDLARLFRATEIYRVRKVLNGIAVRVDASSALKIPRLPGVKAVHPIPVERPTNTSVPFLGVPQLWSDSLGLGQRLTGSGVRIGIVDTGIDYQHANFGGTGALPDYLANDRTVAPDAFFPTAKVVGGYDFAGDAYNGNNAPAPDPDPMDCNGHGTHVAGTAAGFGVDASGTTFAGPYDGSVPFSSLRISPGVAPQALLYALRIFGCTGGTTLTVQAIDWAIDPNGDGTFSDHLDVINLSINADFGDATSPTTLAAENAALAGVVVVAAAGNSSDTYFIAGSSGAAGRAISVAAVADSGAPGGVLLVNSPAAIAGRYAAQAPSFLPAPPPPSGQTANVVLVNDGVGTTSDACQTPFVNAAAMAGKIALIDRNATCSFLTKVANAQANGAIGAIVVNNVAGDPNLISMGGSGPPNILIPSLFISQADGAAIKAQLAAGVNATLAAASAADTLSALSSRGPRDASPLILKPDLAAPGVTITSSQTGVTCTSGACQTPDPSGFLPGSQALTLSGTSMASPHVAGLVALLRELHPTWTVEDLKALVMNGAVHDVTIGASGSGLRYGPGRVGAGRVDSPSSATAEVIAYNTDLTGLVSVSFDGAVVGAVARTKAVRVDNRGPIPARFDLGIDTVVDAPGVVFSLPGGSVLTVPAGAAVEFDVRMDADEAQMDHSREATVAPTQAAPGVLAGLGNLSRHWLTEEAGYLTFSQGGTLRMRVPIYVGARPASTMAAPATLMTGGAPSGSTTLRLAGTDVCSGTRGGGPTCTGTFPVKEVSLTTPFELQVVSPRDSTLPAFADLEYAGVAYSPASNLILFGVSTWGNWASPTDVSFNIYVDGNNDGIWDRILFNSNPGTMNTSLFGGASPAQDSFVTAVFNIATNGVSIGGAGMFVNRASAASFDSRLFDNRVMFLGATPAALGLPVGTTRFRYKIVTCPGWAPLCAQLNGFQDDSAPGPYSWNYAAAAQGLNFSGANLLPDLNGGSIPVMWNLANVAANGSLGALLLHHHNVDGEQAQVVLLEGTPRADLALTKSVSPPNPVTGQNVTYAITVTNGGPNAASGVFVSDLLPVGLTYVSDNGGGAYNPATGQWTAGALAVGAAASLQITATVTSLSGVCNTAQITARTPLDPNPANDQDTACFTITRPRADLVLTKDDGRTTVTPGKQVTYTIRVQNLGPDGVTGATVADAMPPDLLGATWTCAPTAGAACTASGTGSINDTVTLPAGGTLTYTLTATVSRAASGTLSNTATVVVPVGVADSTPANNSQTDTDTLVSPARVGDFNGDGKTDVLLWNPFTGQVQIWLMNSLVATPQPILNGVLGDRVVGTGDYDGDNRADILWQAPGGQAYLWPDASPAGSTLLPPPPFPGGQIVGSGDYDGDGRSDVLWWDPVTGQVQVWLMNGSAVVASGSPGSLPGWEVRGSGDYDGDGRSDILWRNPLTGQTQIWLMNGVTALSKGLSGTLAPTTWQIVGSGDYDGDGRADILWANSVTPGLGVMWLMNGRTVLNQTQIYADRDNYADSGDYDGDGRADTLWLRRNLYVFGTLMNGPLATYKALVGSVPAPAANWRIFRTP